MATLTEHLRGIDRALATVSSIASVFVGSCTVSADTSQKSLVASSFSRPGNVPISGDTFLITFTNTNTALSPSIVIGGQLYLIRYNGSTSPLQWLWADGETVSFTYNGNVMVCNKSVPTTFWGTCASAAATVAKIGIGTSFGSQEFSSLHLKTGTIIGVRFTNGNTASAPTLNIGNTGAYPIYVGNTAAGAGAWANGTFKYLMFNGTQWVTTENQGIL